MSRRCYYLLPVFLLLVACNDARQNGAQDTRDLSAIRARGELVVLTRWGPTTYYQGRDGLAGLEYDMAAAFAASLGVKVRFEIRDSIRDLLVALERGEGDLAAAGLTRTAQRRNHFRYGPVYQTVQQQVVCRRGGPRVRKVADLVGVRLAVPARSSYEERLLALKQQFPELQWQSREEDTEQLMEEVWRRKGIDCTIGDSNIVAVVRRYFPELVVRFELGDPESLSWLLPGQSTELQAAAETWLAQQKDSGELSRLLDKYYGFIDAFDYVDTRTFVRRIKTVLPRYRSLFEAAGRRHGIDWQLLAAQSYQESHWNPRARSPTGVRGIMMLTLITAREVGVRSRLDAAQSIDGAARYLARLRKRIPDAVREPDRTWFALAAYNVGMGHLRDARQLARQLGRDPDFWSELSAVLPLLAQRKYYRKLKHGYARGYEPVRYVNRIRDFHDILRRSIDGDNHGE
ncbi:MAG TPA: membrane-bound lytic murein transglycosylase MltF [Gammaproteobacteria bacterium]|nr:membrane-bound lytic murein transglycosylase MltF [Gammaproteobacteria bacterium]